MTTVHVDTVQASDASIAALLAEAKRLTDDAWDLLNTVGFLVAELGGSEDARRAMARARCKTTDVQTAIQEAEQALKNGKYGKNGGSGC